jgi:hypothetical protein
MATATKKAPAKKAAEKKAPAKKAPAKKVEKPVSGDYNKLEFERVPNQSLMCVSQPRDWDAAFRKAAFDANVPLAAWVGEACKMALPPAIQKKLSVRRSKGRPKPKV